MSANPDIHNNTGLYIHIPFCVRKCDYCDFFSLPGRSDLIEPYIYALLKESEKYRDISFKTVYLGGGTPSLLGASGVKELFEGLRQTLDIAGVVEATIEANPDSVDMPFLEAALESGINRVSIGIQSLNDTELKRIGRIHSADQAVLAIERAAKAGFCNISADVILGLPGQRWDSLMLTLETLIGLDIQHLSMYCLAIEPHTPLSRNVPVDLPTDDDQAELYEKAVFLLDKRGFSHYEISNFALPGYECRHNLNYWRGGEYAGLGPAAASHINGLRYKNRNDLDAYIANPLAQTEDEEKLEPLDKAAEETILRLRLLEEGLDTSLLAQKYNDRVIFELLDRLDTLVVKGSLLRSGSVYRLPPNLALVSNPILADLLGSEFTTD